MSQDKGQAALKAPDFKPKQEYEYSIAYMTVHGWAPKEIAAEIQMAESTVKQKLKDKEMIILIQKLRHKLYGDDPTLKFKVILPKAIDVAEEIMTNKRVKPHVRQEVAFKFMDRALGKPTIEVNIGEGSVRKLLAAIANQNPIDTKPVNPNNDIQDAEYKDVSNSVPSEPVKEEPKPTDDIDNWLDENIK